MDQHVGTSLFDCCLTFDDIYFDSPPSYNSKFKQRLKKFPNILIVTDLRLAFAWPPNIRSIPCPDHHEDNLRTQISPQLFDVDNNDLAKTTFVHITVTRQNLETLNPCP